MRSGGDGLGVANMSLEYVVVARGPLPSDLRERISKAHAEALAAQRSMRGAQAGGNVAQTEAESIGRKASQLPADMLRMVGANVTQKPPDQSLP